MSAVSRKKHALTKGQKVESGLNVNASKIWVEKDTKASGLCPFPLNVFSNYLQCRELNIYLKKSHGKLRPNLRLAMFTIICFFQTQSSSQAPPLPQQAPSTGSWSTQSLSRSRGGSLAAKLPLRAVNGRISELLQGSAGSRSRSHSQGGGSDAAEERGGALARCVGSLLMLLRSKELQYFRKLDAVMFLYGIFKKEENLSSRVMWLLLLARRRFHEQQPFSHLLGNLYAWRARCDNGRVYGVAILFTTHLKSAMHSTSFWCCLLLSVEPWADQEAPAVPGRRRQRQFKRCLHLTARSQLPGNLIAAAAAMPATTGTDPPADQLVRRGSFSLSSSTAESSTFLNMRVLALNWRWWSWRRWRRWGW